MSSPPRRACFILIFFTILQNETCLRAARTDVAVRTIRHGLYDGPCRCVGAPAIFDDFPPRIFQMKFSLFELRPAYLKSLFSRDRGPFNIMRVAVFHRSVPTKSFGTCPFPRQVRWRPHALLPVSVDGSPTPPSRLHLKMSLTSFRDAHTSCLRTHGNDPLQGNSKREKKTINLTLNTHFGVVQRPLLTRPSSIKMVAVF